MKTSRALAMLGLALLSIGAGSGSEEEEEASNGLAGSGSALVAPKDAKARADWLRERLSAALAAHPTLGKAPIGVAVIDLATGTELFAHDADRPMELASTTKLLTSVAALGQLGGGFRWRTAVYVDDLDEATGTVKGDLYVRGRGDPTLTVADLRALAADVAAHGVRTVEGHLVIDASYFDAVTEPPHFAEQPKERAAFRAPIAAFGVNKSAVTVNVIAEPGGAARVWLDPEAGDYIQLKKIEVKSEDKGRTRLRVEDKVKGDHLEVDVTGTIRASDGGYDTRKRVDDPLRFAGEVFEHELAEQGVKLGKKAIGTGTVPLTAKQVAAHDSAPLALVVRDMNKNSDNYLAESVLKTLGAETRATPGPATWADGVTAVHLYLAALGLPAGSYRADNGSGLFDASAVSAHQLAHVLRAAHADYRIGPDLVASLPVGGSDGTLAKRWKNHAAKGRVRAKTGTLDKVTSLAGYVGIDSGHPLAFAIIVNEIPAGQRKASRAMADDVVDVLVAYLEAR